MNMAANAYAKTSQITPLSARALESTLLMKAAAQMQAVRNDWEGRQAELPAALDYNNKLWTILVTSATSPDNPLPLEVKQNVGNIGIFVLAQTMAMGANPVAEKLDSLIRINRELAAGLRA